MNQPGVLLVPVRAHFSTQRNTNSDTNHMTRRITNNLVSLLLNLNNHGDSFRAEEGERVVVEVALVSRTFQNLPVDRSSINDNHCSMSQPVQLRLCCGVLNQVPSKDKLTCQKTVNLHVVPPAVSVNGQLQKKNISPSSPKVEIKSVNDVLCVNQCISAPNVRNVPHVVKDPPVGGRLQRFWQVWLSLGSNPRVVSILREGYHLPFKERPPPNKIPCDSQWFLKSLTKQKSERGVTVCRSKTSYRKGFSSVVSGFLQPVVLGSKAQQKMEAHSGLKSTKPCTLLRLRSRWKLQRPFDSPFSRESGSLCWILATLTFTSQ